MQKSSNKFLPILAYHKIQDNFDFSVTYVTPRRFQAQIELLAESGYETISIADYINAPLAVDKKVILTFDDAYASVFDQALPVLAKHGFTASIFPITKYIGATNKWDYNSFKRGSMHCTWKQLKALANAGWEIGSHTESHPNLRSLSERDLWQEMKNSKDTLEANLGVKVCIISYPFGKYSKKVHEVAREAGYVGGCTLGYNYPNTQLFPYALFRRGVYLFDSKSRFCLKLTNDIWTRFDDAVQRAITFLAQGTLLLRYFKSLQK